MEIVCQIGFRLSAGYDFDKSAVMLEEHRDDLQRDDCDRSVLAAWTRLVGARCLGSGSDLPGLRPGEPRGLPDLWDVRNPADNVRRVVP